MSNIVNYFLKQVVLLRGGWNELLIAGFAFRSTSLEEGILWADGAVITRDNAHLCGVGDIFDRVQVELVAKMKEMKMVSKRTAKLFHRTVRKQFLGQIDYHSNTTVVSTEHTEQTGWFPYLPSTIRMSFFRVGLLYITSTI